MKFYPEANLIPIELLKEREYQKAKKKLLTFLLVCTTILGCAFAYEGVLTLINVLKPNQGISAELEQQYQLAQSKKKELDKKTALLRQALKDRSKAVEYADALTLARPNQVWFTQLEIAPNQNNTEIEILLKGYGSDASVFGSIPEGLQKERPDLYRAAELQKVEINPTNKLTGFQLRIIGAK